MQIFPKISKKVVRWNEIYHGGYGEKGRRIRIFRMEGLPGKISRWGPGELNRRGHREHGDKRRRNVSMLLAPASAGETQRHKGKHFDRKDHNNDAIATKGYAFSWRSLHLVCGSVISEPVEEGQ
jgi:hypothetical protein